MDETNAPTLEALARLLETAGGGKHDDGVAATARWLIEESAEGRSWTGLLSLQSQLYQLVSPPDDWRDPNDVLDPTRSFGCSFTQLSNLCRARSEGRKANRTAQSAAGQGPQSRGYGRESGGDGPAAAPGAGGRGPGMRRRRTDRLGRQRVTRVTKEDVSHEKCIARSEANFHWLSITDLCPCSLKRPFERRRPASFTWKRPFERRRLASLTWIGLFERRRSTACEEMTKVVPARAIISMCSRSRRMLSVSRPPET